MAQTDYITVVYDSNTALRDRIAVVTPQDTTFRSRLQEIIGPAAVEALRGLDRFCLIIKNTSTAPIMVVTVRYDVTDRSGRTFHWIFRKEGIAARNGQYFSPGKSYVVAPSTRAQLLLGRKPVAGDELRAEVTQWLQEHDVVAKIAIVVDSILLTDGRLLGPDRSDSFTELSSWVRAEDDLIRELEAALSTKSGDEIALLLKSKRDVTSADFAGRNPYARRQELLANALLHSLERGGVSVLAGVLQKLKARPSLTISR